MDLVEVAPEARPPVVKMMDYGKYKYEADRQRREARKKQHTIKVKEVKFQDIIRSKIRKNHYFEPF